MLLPNTQAPEKKTTNLGAILDVIDIWRTVQGEAIHAGRPAVFVRLSGCQLMCPMCDTNYTEGRHLVSVPGILNSILETGHKDDLIVITGGEPFRQEIGVLCKHLNDWNRDVQIETNGGIFRECAYTTDVVCSPKTSKIAPETAEFVDAWKYVVEAGKVDTDGLPLSALGMKQVPAKPTNDKPVYIQPLDSQNHEINLANQKAAVESCMEHGYRLCLQVHKIVGLP